MQSSGLCLFQKPFDTPLPPGGENDQRAYTFNFPSPAAKNCKHIKNKIKKVIFKLLC